MTRNTHHASGRIDRRSFLALTGALAGSAALAGEAGAQAPRRGGTG